MNTLTSSTAQAEASHATGGDRPHVEQPRRDPVGRVVSGSLATGFVGAGVLTVGIFGGAREHVVTASALLSFALGWALLAVLSGRFTSRRQRWAWVPAGAMTLAAAWLFAARPDDRALDTAGWVWPPVAFALAVWMFVRVRRGFDGRVRWVLYPVLASIALGAVGGTYETVTRAHDRRAYPAPGELYDVGGHRLHLNCTGSGSPTVVLVSGLGGMSAGWTRITAALGSETRVCAYDRAGQGWSDDVDSPQDAVAIADDLHTLLARAGESGPYVFVGHSAGGPYAMTYAAGYPDEVAGMVLLDSMSPDEFTDLPGFATEQWLMHRGLGLLPSLTRLGLGRTMPTSVWSSLPEPAASQVRAFASSARGMRSMRDEQSMFRTAFEQAKALRSLGGKPVVVVTATESMEQNDEWVDLQERLAALSSNHDHRVVVATHAGLVDDPALIHASVQAIVDTVRAVRTEGPVAGQPKGN